MVETKIASERTIEAPPRERSVSARIAAKNVSPPERLGSTLSGVALALGGLARRGVAGLALAGLGGALIHRGISGRCAGYAAIGVTTAREDRARAIPRAAVVAVRAVTIDAPRDTVVRAFWHAIDTLPCFLRSVSGQTPADRRRAHRDAFVGEGGVACAWPVELREEREDEVSWRGGRVDHDGRVQFGTAPGGRGTEVRIELEHLPRGGIVGALFAKLAGRDAPTVMLEDLRCLKALIEAGEIATTDGQSAGAGRTT